MRIGMGQWKYVYSFMFLTVQASALKLYIFAGSTQLDSCWRSSRLRLFVAFFSPPKYYWDCTSITPGALHSVRFSFHHSRSVILSFNALHSFNYLRLHMHPLKFMLYI
jgi:hypothetical protein